MYVLIMCGKLAPELRECDVEVTLWPAGHDGDHHIYHIPMESSLNALAYSRRYRRLLDGVLDIEAGYNFGGVDAATTRWRLQNDWLPRVERFINQYGPYRVPRDIQRMYNRARGQCGLSPRVVDTSCDVVYHSDDGVVFYPVLYVLGGWMRVGGSILLEPGELE